MRRRVPLGGGARKVGGQAGGILEPLRHGGRVRPGHLPARGGGDDLPPGGGPLVLGQAGQREQVARGGCADFYRARNARLDLRDL